MRKGILFIIVMILFVLLKACTNEKMHFERFDNECGYQLDSDGLKNKFSETYFVSEYNATMEAETAIEIFACEKANSVLKKIDKYSITFYKKSAKTNLEYLRKHPKYFHRGNPFEGDGGSLINDFLWTYSFDKKKRKVKRLKPKNYSGYKFFNDIPDCLEWN
jgi:hypothetical protein